MHNLVSIQSFKACLMIVGNLLTLWLCSQGVPFDMGGNMAPGGGAGMQQQPMINPQQQAFRQQLMGNHLSWLSFINPTTHLALKDVNGIPNFANF